MSFDSKKDAKTVNKVIEALKANGISAELASREDAKDAALKQVPKDAEVFTMTSITLETLGIAKEINESGNYKSARNIFYSQDSSLDPSQKRKLGAGPDVAMGSVHAVTEDGKVMIASNTGSQLAAYAYGAGKVVWVVGTQKIVKDIDEGLKRINEHAVPLEDARALKAYGIHTNLSKLLIINKETNPERLHIIFVDDVIGF